jgi:glycerol-3-phosphate dehydrogenase
VADRSPGAQTYFLHPWKDRIFAGTYEAPWKGSVEEGPPGEALVADFLAKLNAAVPGLDLKLEEVLRLHWGLLPAAAEGTAKLAVRPQWVDHGARGGPYGLYSISGVKFTTARLVAERSLRALFKSRGESLPPHSEIKRPAPRRVLAAEEFERLLHRDRSRAQADLVQLAKEEAVIHADDILLRRTDWGIEPGPGPATAEAVRALVDVSN